MQHYGGRADAPKWAMAGRSAAKLAEVLDRIGAPADTPLIVADSDDDEALGRMAAQARVVLTTVGPYQFYGEPLVRACATQGTDYVDLCGEPLWMRAMIDAYDTAARQSGARIVFSCGFDSIPFDLVVRMLQKEAMRRVGRPAPRVKGRYDPGYGSTSRMIAEAGMALLGSPAPGRIGTPGAILGEALVDRLRDHAEMSFSGED